MQKYQSIYKCRLCGKVFNGAMTGSEVIAIQAASTLTVCNDTVGKIQGIPMARYEVHTCEDGSFGFADFQGFKAV